MRRGLAALARLAGPLLLAETRCPGCGRVVRAALDRDSVLCAACQAELGAGDQAACPCCGAGREDGTACAGCLAAPRPWGRLAAWGPYEGRLRELILEYKFSARLDLGRQLQECLAGAFARARVRHPELAACDALVPVPLHPARLAWRGFNQSRELARLVSARFSLPFRQEALVRVRRTVPQMELSRAERAGNIRGAFAARGDLLAGRTVLLVDDIMTTGSTLEECSRMMLGVGAAQVHVLVLARA